MGDRLTEKQEKFCQALIGGKGLTESYRIAYNTHCTDSTAISKASAILSEPKISKRLEELRKPLEDAITADNASARQRQIDFIQSRIQICKMKEDETSIIRYTDMLNKIYGAYNSTGQEEEQQSQLAQMDDNMLRKLTGAMDRDSNKLVTEEA